MALTAVLDRQYPLEAVCDLRIANIGASNGHTMKLPPNALLCETNAVIETPFNSATTTTISAGDGTVVFISAVDAKAAAGVSYSNTARQFYPSGGTITWSMAETGATATLGRAIGRIQYIVLGRGQEVQVS